MSVERLYMQPFRSWQIIAFSVLGVFISAATVRAESIRIGGTGSALGVMRIMGKAFSEAHMDTTVELLPSLGSGGGIRALVDGKIDVAISARPLKESERAGPIAARYYGRTPLALAVHGNVGLDNLAVSDVVAIFRGEQTRWPTGRRIRVVLRPGSETDAKLLIKAIDGLGEAYETARHQTGIPTAYNDQENAEALMAMPGSLGTISLSQILGEGLPLRTLALDGIHPTVANVEDGTYRLWKGYWMVTAENRPRIVDQFLEFVRSPQGQALLRQTGHDTTPPSQ